VAWSLIWSTLDGLEYSDRGMMAAWEPWSGHYAISVAIWATAQTTQFVDLPKPKSVNAGAQEPGADNEGGFSMLGVSTGGSGVLAGGGTFVTYVAREPGGAPARRLTIVFETMAAANNASGLQHLALAVAGLAPQLCGSKTLSLWTTNTSAPFAGPFPVDARPAPAPAPAAATATTTSSCVFDLVLPPRTIATITTEAGSKLRGVTKAPLPIPASSSFLGKGNFSTKFDERAVGRPPLYFSDQGGSFALAEDGENNMVLRQMVPVHPVTGMGPAGPTWTGVNALPATVIGDVAAVNIRSTVRARLPPPTASAPASFAALCGRIASSQHPYDPDHGGDPPGDCLNLTSAGEWKLTQGAPVGGAGNVTLRGRLPSGGFDRLAWHSLELRLMGTHTAGYVDAAMVFNVSSDGARGYVALASSYAPVDFDDFTMDALPGPPVPPPGDGTKVVFAACAPGSQPLSSQQGWELVKFPVAVSDDDDRDDGDGDNAIVTIRPTVDKSLCLDFSDVTGLKLKSCGGGGGAAQRWNTSEAALKSAGGGYVRAAGLERCPSGSGGALVGGCCMEVQGNTPDPGTPADIYGCEESSGAPCANEVFMSTSIDGIARLVAGSTGFCLSASSGAETMF
jgi:hypothetical protein